MDKSTPTPMDLARTERANVEEAIGAVVRRVERLDEDPIGEHVEAFEEAHRVLQESLNEAVDG